MDTSQMGFPGLIRVLVCKTGCVDDLNLGKERKISIMSQLSSLFTVQG